MNQASSESEAAKPWFKEVWWWMVFGPLFFVVGVSTLNVYIAFSGADDVVKDEYTKVGKSYEKDFSVEARAKQLGVTGLIEFDRQSNVLRLNLSAKNLTDTLGGVALTLHLLHPKLEERDMQITLAGDGPLYREIVPELSELNGRWNIRIEASDNQQQIIWRLTGTIHLDYQTSLRLQ